MARRGRAGRSWPVRMQHPDWGLPRRVARPSAQGYPLRHRRPGRRRLAALPRRWADTRMRRSARRLALTRRWTRRSQRRCCRRLASQSFTRPAMGSVVSRADRGWEISGVRHGDHRQQGLDRGVAMQGPRRIPGRVRSCDNASSGACEVPAATSPPRSGGSGLFAPPRGHDQGRARESWPPGAPVRLATLEG
jgi:hypothetical protein